MSIYEAIGVGFVIFMACVGCYTTSRMVYEGIKRIEGRSEIGKEFEDAAVRDHLGSSSMLLEKRVR